MKQYFQEGYECFVIKVIVDAYWYFTTERSYYASKDKTSIKNETVIATAYEQET